MRPIVLACLTAALLVSPALAWNPKEPINGFSRESLYRSIKAITRDMTDEEKRVFRRGFNAMMLSDFPLTFGMSADEAKSFLPMAMEAAHITMDGVSLGEIMARGAQLDQLARTNAPVSEPEPSPEQPSEPTFNPITQIAELDRKQAEREKRDAEHLEVMRACLAEKIPLEATYVRKGGVFDDLELTLTNNLSWPISYIGMDYEIRTEGRKLALAEKEIARTLRNGLAPGETRMVRITVSAVPKEVLVEALDMTIRILNVADMDGRSLLSHPKSLFVGGLSDKTCE